MSRTEPQRRESPIGDDWDSFEWRGRRARYCQLQSFAELREQEQAYPPPELDDFISSLHRHWWQGCSLMRLTHLALDLAVLVCAALTLSFPLLSSAPLPYTTPAHWLEPTWQRWAAWSVDEMGYSAKYEADRRHQRSDLPWFGCTYSVKANGADGHVLPLTLDVPGCVSLVVLRPALYVLAFFAIMLCWELLFGTSHLWAARREHDTFLVDLNSDGYDTLEPIDAADDSDLPPRMQYPTREQMTAFHRLLLQRCAKRAIDDLVTLNRYAATAGCLAAVSIVSLAAFLTTPSLSNTHVLPMAWVWLGLAPGWLLLLPVRVRWRHRTRRREVEKFLHECWGSDELTSAHTPLLADESTGEADPAGTLIL